MKNTCLQTTQLITRHPRPCYRWPRRLLTHKLALACLCGEHQLPHRGSLLWCHHRLLGVVIYHSQVIRIMVNWSFSLHHQLNQPSSSIISHHQPSVVKKVQARPWITKQPVYFCISPFISLLSISLHFGSSSQKPRKAILITANHGALTTCMCARKCNDLNSFPVRFGGILWHAICRIHSNYIDSVITDDTT